MLVRLALVVLLAGCAAGVPQAPGPDAGEPPPPACAPWTGDQQWGTGLDDEVTALARVGHGVAVAGYRGGRVGVSDLGPVGDSAGFVRVLATGGALSWEASLDTAGSDLVEALAVEPGGQRIFAVGRTTGAFENATNGGQFDAFVATLGPGGERQAVAQHGDERPQHPRGAVLSGGELWIGGFDDTYVPSNYVEDWANPFFARLSTATLQPAFWTASRTALVDQGMALAPAAGGDGVYFVGMDGAGAERGVWVRRIDHGGHEVWRSRITRSSLDYPGAIAVAPDGTLLLALAQIVGGSEPVLYSLDGETGAKRWAARLDRDLNGAAPTGLALDELGNAFVVGNTLSPITDADVSRGAFDPFVLRFDPEGTLTGTWMGGTPDDEEATSIALDGCGRVLIGGWTYGALAGEAHGGRDAFLVSVALRTVEPVSF